MNRTVAKTLTVAMAVAAMFCTITWAEPEKKDFTPEFVAECKAKAEAGDAEGQMLYGRALLEGWGVASNHVEAVEWLTKAAISNQADACEHLSFCYLLGCGVEKDEKKANMWRQKAAELGNAIAQFILGIQCQIGEQDEAKAAEWYRKAAEQGLAGAQLSLGDCYNFGRGVEKDDKEAFKWYLKAAEQGEPNAQLSLGNCYNFGRGIEKDDEEAFKWYLKAAEQGEPNAQSALGTLYESDTFAKKDIIKAIEWYQKAAEKGEGWAQFRLGRFYTMGIGVKKDDLMAVEWFKKAAQLGIVSAQYELGECYHVGRGIKKDVDLACHWLQKAACQDHADAQWVLSQSYISGDIVPVSIDKALQLLLKLAKHHDNDLPLSRKNLHGIIQAIEIIRDRSPYGKQHVQILQVTANNFALVYRISESDFERKKDILAMKIDRNRLSQEAWLRARGKNYLKLLTVNEAKADFREWYRLESQRLHSEMVRDREALLNTMLASIVGNNIGVLHAEGEEVVFEKLYWAATHSYETLENSVKTVPQFSPDLGWAITFVRHKLGLYDETDPILGDTEEKAFGEKAPSDGKQKVQKEEEDGKISLGSGFFVTHDGFFLTNYHVVKNRAQLEILLYGQTFTARCVDFDSGLDIALLKVDAEGKPLPFLQFSGRRIANLGEDVYAIGYPRPTMQGTSVKVTKGVISSLRGAMDNPHRYQIDAAVQPGNSGGPLVDSAGNVMGMVVSKFKNTEAMIETGTIAQNVNYAIKNSVILAFLDSNPECEYKIADKPAKSPASTSGISENVTKACGLVIAYEGE